MRALVIVRIKAQNASRWGVGWRKQNTEWEKKF